MLCSLLLFLLFIIVGFSFDWFGLKDNYDMISFLTVHHSLLLTGPHNYLIKPCHHFLYTTIYLIYLNINRYSVDLNPFHDPRSFVTEINKNGTPTIIVEYLIFCCYVWIHLKTIEFKYFMISSLDRKLFLKLSVSLIFLNT